MFSFVLSCPITVGIMATVLASGETHIPQLTTFFPLPGVTLQCLSLAFFKVLWSIVRELTLINSCHFKVCTENCLRIHFFPYSTSLEAFSAECFYTENTFVYLLTQMSTNVYIKMQVKKPLVFPIQAFWCDSEYMCFLISCSYYTQATPKAHPSLLHHLRHCRHFGIAWCWESCSSFFGCIVPCSMVAKLDKGT